MLTEGNVGVIEKFLDSREFGSGVNHFQDACLAVDRQEGKQDYREALMAGKVKLEDEDLEIDYEDEINRAA